MVLIKLNILNKKIYAQIIEERNYRLKRKFKNKENNILEKESYWPWTSKKDILENENRLLKSRLGDNYWKKKMNKEYNNTIKLVFIIFIVYIGIAIYLILKL